MEVIRFSVYYLISALSLSMIHPLNVAMELIQGLWQNKSPACRPDFVVSRAKCRSTPWLEQTTKSARCPPKPTAYQITSRDTTTKGTSGASFAHELLHYVGLFHPPANHVFG